MKNILKKKVDKTMNNSIINIKEYFDTNFGHAIKAFTKMSESKSGKSLVISSNKAFDYDDINKSYYEKHNMPCSADSLYLTESVNFIEFKTIDSEIKDKIKYDIVINNLNLKAIESIVTFNNEIVPCCTKTINNNEITTIFIVVINSEASSSTAMGLAFSDIIFNKKQTGIELSLSRFKAKDLKGRKIYHDDVKVWYDREFDLKLANL